MATPVLIQVPLNTLLDQWIEIMQDVVDNQRGFFLDFWQMVAHDAVTTAEELHSCGAVACGAGHLAVSSFWRGIGGRLNEEGAPTYAGELGSEAIRRAVLGDYRKSCIGDLVFGEVEVYGKEPEEVTAQDFLDALIRFRRTGTPYLPEYDA